MFNIHSKVIAVFVICVAVIASVVIFKKDQNTKPIEKVAIVKDIQEGSDFIDTDNDGLKDWEEDLIGSSITKNDTDSDGTLDGEEVKLGRDPNKAGPNDSVKAKTFEAEPSETENQPKNLTSSVAENFFASYLDAKKEGFEMTGENIEQIVTGSLNQNDLTLKPVVYDIEDVKVSNKEDRSAYKTALENAVYSNSPKNLGDPNAIIKNIIEKNSQPDLKQLSLYISSYKNLIDDTLKIEIPRTAIGLHIVYLNTISAIHKIFTDISNAKNDPVSMYIALNNYSLESQKLKVVLTRFDKYFK